jgi:hypothetical protein
MVILQPRLKPRFSGSFSTWRKEIFTNREQGIVQNFLVFSSGKREAVLEYLWLKFLWNELTRTEYTLFILSLKESEDDQKKWAFLKVLLQRPKSELRKKLIRFEEFFGLKLSSRERYLGYKGMSIEIHLENRRLGRVPKYSGYVKSISAIGSKKKNSLSDILSDVIPTDLYFDEKVIDWYHLLSVGSISLFSAEVEVLFNPDEDQKVRNAAQKL